MFSKQIKEGTYLLVGLRAAEILLVIPLGHKDPKSIEDFISKNLKWQIPLNTKVVGILSLKSISEEEEESSTWSEIVK